MTDTLHAPTSAERPPAQAPASDAQVSVVGERKEPPPSRITWEDFLAWADESTRAEWVDGEVIVLSPSNVVDLRLISFLHRVLAAFVEARQLGEIFLMDLLMRLETRPSGREPDLVFIATEHLDRLKDTYLDGPADLAVEVVSPDSDVRDRSEKFREYEGAGIPEYWLLDPIRREALFYRLGDDGRYHLVPIGEDGLFRSVVLPGFTLRIAWLWQRPLPAVTDVMRQVGV